MYRTMYAEFKSQKTAALVRLLRGSKRLLGNVLCKRRDSPIAHAHFARGADPSTSLRTGCVRPNTKSLVGFAEDELSGGGATFEVCLHQQR